MLSTDEKMNLHAEINADEIVDDATLHDVFARVMGFPEFYGRNWNAWIDCMTYLDDGEAGMSRRVVDPGTIFLLGIRGAKGLQERCPEIFRALVECAAFVNSRRMEVGEGAVLGLVLM